MTEAPRTGVYRGATDAEATAQYHAEAGRFASEGFVPVSEQWSTALGQTVLTVSYLHAPDQTPGVLEALRQSQLDPSRCRACGKPLSPAWRTKCEHCGTPFGPDLLAARARGSANAAFLPVAAGGRREVVQYYRSTVYWSCLGRIMLLAGLVIGFVVGVYVALAFTKDVLPQLLIAFIVGPALGAFLAWWLWTELWGGRGR